MGRGAAAFGPGLAEDLIAPLAAPSARTVICSPATWSACRQSLGVTTAGCLSTSFPLPSVPRYHYEMKLL